MRLTWQEALVAYERSDWTYGPDVQIGRMKCLHALGEGINLPLKWRKWSNATTRNVENRTHGCSKPCLEWMGLYGKLHSTLKAIPQTVHSPCHPFVHKSISQALVYIAKARDLLEPELTSFVGESYGRSIGKVHCLHEYMVLCFFSRCPVRAQMLSELEEIMRSAIADQPERQQSWGDMDER